MELCHFPSVAPRRGPAGAPRRQNCSVCDVRRRYSAFPALCDGHPHTGHTRVILSDTPRPTAAGQSRFFWISRRRSLDSESNMVDFVSIPEIVSIRGIMSFPGWGPSPGPSQRPAESTRIVYVTRGEGEMRSQRSALVPHTRATLSRTPRPPAATQTRLRWIF